MKILLGLILVVGLLATGCASFNRSEIIDTDQQGYASGRYSANSQGPTGSVTIGGAGGASGSFWAGGAGGMAVTVETGPPQATPYYFAKSIAMINYSRKLKAIKYDQMGGIVEYQFDSQPVMAKSVYQPAAAQKKLPASFGHQPVE